MTNELPQPKRSEQLELFDTLENLVDRNSLTSVLETLATICAQKANKYGDWQYGGLSAAWQDMYERLEQARAASTTSLNETEQLVPVPVLSVPADTFHVARKAIEDNVSPMYMDTSGDEEHMYLFTQCRDLPGAKKQVSFY